MMEPIKVRRRLPSKWILALDLLYKLFESVVMWRKSPATQKYFEDVQWNREVDELEEAAQILEEKKPEADGN